jgi:phage/plasmid-like protein (TIGR03299 family)
MFSVIFMLQDNPAIEIKSDRLGNSLRGTGGFDSEKVKQAASEIKSNLRKDGYKGMIDDGYYKGVGAQVDAKMSFDTRLEKAGLNWSTETSILKYGDKMQYLDVKQQAVYRGDTGELFGVTSDTWQPYQNRDVVGAFDEFCQGADIEMERLGSLKNGRLVFASAIVNESWAVMDTDDVIAARLILTNSHEYGIGMTARLAAVRLVCCNGMTRKVAVGQRSIGHNTAFSKEAINAILHNSKSSFAKLGETIDLLCQVRLNNQEAKNFLVETLGDRNEKGGLESFYEQNKLVRSAYYNYANHCSVGAHLEASQSNAWELLNCVTEEINHNSRSLGEAHINSLWNGGKAQIESKVLSAMEYTFLNRKNKNAQTQMVGA